MATETEMSKEMATAMAEIAKKMAFEMPFEVALEMVEKAIKKSKEIAIEKELEPKKWVSAASAVFPAGTYYVGDSCFVLEDEPYDALIESWNYAEEFLEKAESGQKIGMFRLPGDGCYEDTKGRIYGVDAGHIAILPTKFSILCSYGKSCGINYKEDTEVELKPFGGTYITFENEFHVEYVQDKYISIEDKVNPQNSFKIWIESQESDEEDD